MVRSVRTKRIDTKARLNLPARREPYWQVIERGLSVGYHRPLRGGAGTWWARLLVGARYRIAAIGAADDHVAADGETALSWAQAQSAVRAWAATQTAAGPYTVGDACSDYVADLRARRGDVAAKGAEGRLRKHVPEKLRRRLLADLDEGDLLTWRNGLVPVGEGDEEMIRSARDSANRVRSILWAALTLAFTSRKVTSDRAWRRVGPFEDVGVARKVFLSDAEQQRFVDACGPGLRELVVGLAETGARLGELTGARVRDFDNAGATLTVRSNKGRRGRTRQREIHLAPTTVALLLRLASGKGPADFLFTTADGAPWTKSLHQRPVKTAVKKAGLDPEATIYSLRHSYISRALKQGIPTKAVALQCGTSIQMIEKHYAKFISADLAACAKMAAPSLRLEPAEKVARLEVA